MRPLRLRLNVEALDCYIYFGQLFVVLDDGIYAIPLWRIISPIITDHKEYTDILTLAFVRNDYISSQASSKHLFGIPGIKAMFSKYWLDICNNEDLSVNWSDISKYATKISDLNSLDFIDFRFYAGRMYVGEYCSFTRVDLNIEDENIVADKPFKLSDNYVASINSNFGSVLVSGGEDGLFAFDALETETFLYRKPQQISGSSVRICWNGANFVNYDGMGFYLVENRKEKVAKHANVSNRYFEKNELSRITEFNVSSRSEDDLLNKSKIESKEIIFAFNSSEKGFFFMKDGSIKVKPIRRNGDDIYFSSKGFKIENISGNTPVSRPLSGSTIAKGFVLEFLDKVLIHQCGDTFVHKFSIGDCSSVRSYLNSKRNQNVLSVVTSSYIDLLSLNPFANDCVNQSRRTTYPQKNDIEAPDSVEIDLEANGFSVDLGSDSDKYDLPF